MPRRAGHFLHTRAHPEHGIQQSIQWGEICTPVTTGTIITIYTTISSKSVLLHSATAQTQSASWDPMLHLSKYFLLFSRNPHSSAWSRAAFPKHCLSPDYTCAELCRELISHRSPKYIICAFSPSQVIHRESEALLQSPMDRTELYHREINGFLLQLPWSFQHISFWSYTQPPSQAWQNSAYSINIH